MWTWLSKGESNNPLLYPFPSWFSSGSFHTLHYRADVPKSASPHWPHLCWGEGLWQHPLSHAASSQVGRVLSHAHNRGNLCFSCRSEVSGLMWGLLLLSATFSPFCPFNDKTLCQHGAIQTDMYCSKNFTLFWIYCCALNIICNARWIICIRKKVIEEGVYRS